MAKPSMNVKWKWKFVMVWPVWPARCGFGSGSDYSGFFSRTSIMKWKMMKLVMEPKSSKRINKYKRLYKCFAQKKWRTVKKARVWLPAIMLLQPENLGILAQNCHFLRRNECLRFRFQRTLHINRLYSIAKQIVSCFMYCFSSQSTLLVIYPDTSVALLLVLSGFFPPRGCLGLDHMFYFISLVSYW